jgi:HPt (histidine-containing phosphotransfer) domain-containing protein
MGLSATLSPSAQRQRTVAPSAAPIDHAHLSRYTLGNYDLEVEVLGLFAGQAPQTLAWLTSSGTPKSWRDAAHTLKGSARAVGAWQVAIAAEQAEALSQSVDLEARRQAIAALTQALDVACAYIATLDERR